MVLGHRNGFSLSMLDCIMTITHRGFTTPFYTKFKKKIKINKRLHLIDSSPNFQILWSMRHYWPKFHFQVSNSQLSKDVTGLDDMLVIDWTTVTDTILNLIIFSDNPNYFIPPTQTGIFHGIFLFV